MTKPQIWVAAFLGLFLILFIIGKITKKEEPVNNPTNMPTGPVSQDLSGEELFSSFGCVNCHGSDFKGTKLAPALANLKEFWGRDNLINYLRNPSSFMDNDRFKEYRKNYPGTMMPSYSNKDIKQLGKIADYLLTR
jgi:mono/diheme cytochrome c family protein